MAEYVSKTRTNYFAVEDAEAFAKLIGTAKADNGGSLTVIHTSKNPDDDTVKYGFYCDGQLRGLPYSTETGQDADPDEEDDDTDEYDLEKFYAELQKLVSPGDACIIMEAGTEAMRYVAGYAVVLTHDKRKFINLSNFAQSVAKQLLGNENWTTKMEY